MKRKERIKLFKRWFAIRNIVHVCNYKMIVYDVNDARWSLWYDIKMKCYKAQAKDYELDSQCYDAMLKNWNKLYKQKQHFVQPTIAARICLKKVR